MKAHHGIEINDEVTFFKLHDLDGDGYWDEGELKYMFGVESDTDPNSSHIQHVIARIYQEIDTNNDRFISLKEYIAKKLAAVASEANNEKPQKEKAKTDSKPKANSTKEKTPKSKSKKKASNKSNSDPMFINRNGYEGIPLKFRV